MDFFLEETTGMPSSFPGNHLLIFHGISALSHLCFLLGLSVVWYLGHFMSSRDSERQLEASGFLFYRLSIFTSMSLGLLHLPLSVLIYLWYRHDYILFTIEASLTIRSLAWFAATAYLLVEFGISNEERFPTFLRIWWGLFLPMSCSCLVVDMLYLKRHEAIRAYQLVFDSSSIIAGLILNYSGFFGQRVWRTNHGEPLLDGSNRNRSSTEIGSGHSANSLFENASILSILSFSWIGPLLSVGHKKTLELNDIPQLASNDSVHTVFPIFKSILQSYARATAHCRITSFMLVKALILTVWAQYLLVIFYALLSSVASFVGPYLLDYLVRYLSSDHKLANQGYIMVMTFIMSKIVESLCDRHFYFRILQMRIRVRSSLVALIYQKGLMLSSHSRQSVTSGEILTYMSTDASRVGDLSWFILDLLSVPVQIFLSLLILYPRIGGASLVSLMATFLVMLLNIPLTKCEQNYTEKLMKSKDNRIKATTEILKNMRILKLQAWEMKFLSKVMELRKTETKWLWKYACTSAAATFLFSCSSIFVAVVAFGTCMLMGIPLETGKVLSALATFRLLQDPIFSLPDVISGLVQTKVSADRISTFLNLEDLQHVVQKLPRDSCELSIEVSNGNFAWDPSSQNLTLKEVNLQVLKGRKVAVCGSVGSGKTSLLHCILGEVPKISGDVKLYGTTSYVSQSPWILSGSIQDNILFGKQMDNVIKYERVLEACSLKKDLEIMPLGDQTIIGERGINLSGGQKQRVQIARALYHEADIYLFDDPFSAVDAHTASHLFKECLLGLLSSKTVVYVTHQVEFLPSADLILVIRDGRVAEAGTYTELVDSGTEFMQLVNAHNHALVSNDLLDLDPQASSNSTQVGHSDSMVPKEKESVCEETNSTSNEDSKKGQLVQEEEREKGKVGFQVYWRYITMAYKGTLVPFIILSLIFYQVLEICGNYWMALEVPLSDDTEPRVSGSTLISVYVALAVGSSACILVRTMLTMTAGLKTATLLFNSMHTCIFRAPISFFDSTPTGRILSRVSSEQGGVDIQIPFLFSSFAFLIIRCLGTITVMSQVAWPVFIVFIPVFFTSFWYQQYYISTSRELSRLLGVCRAPVIQHFAESLSGSVSVRSFDQENEFVNTNYNLSNDFSRIQFHIAGAMEWLSFRLDILSILTFAFSLIFLICMPYGIINPGIAGLAVTYGLKFDGIQTSFIWILCNLENKIISVERILQYSSIPSEPPLIVEDNRPDHSWPSKGEIDIVNIQVRYGLTMPFILRGLTCTFPGGKKTGIVGRTGSGKSTLIQTIFRIIDPAVGHIFIDGTDISTIGLHDLRSRLGIIPQEPIMFQGTLRNNLDPLDEHTDEEIWETLDCCQLGEEIRKKELKLDSGVAENGENWSVGQRQLVCLGRVILKKSKILVLDEATASVDTSTDIIIQNTLRQQFSESTVITVAHRITSVIGSDLVLVLENGVIVELGSPKNLLANKSSLFAKLVSEYTTRFYDASK
ncbi:ABC transporter C family member 3-like isoform X2 [Zingiber officinale]|uniref:ABC transporter C family member 3-like isoform X2 n=1 Tax=Zingiber officinale TaxID=94328 RepID=UPI001C4CE02C|nr:ABC transporter C family member 3-like isoform X2 [Zingiber officinale]